MKCVRCDGVLESQSYEGVEIDRCPKCRGTWLDEGELQKIITTDIEKFSAALVSEAVTLAFAGIPADENRSLERCPKCTKPMMPLNYSYNSGVIIDRCPDSHGVWLDAMELEKVQASRQHWDAEMKEHRDEWIGLIRNLELKKAGATAEANRATMRPTKYWVNSLLRRILA